MQGIRLRVESRGDRSWLFRLQGHFRVPLCPFLEFLIWDLKTESGRDRSIDLVIDSGLMSDSMASS